MSALSPACARPLFALLRLAWTAPLAWLFAALVALRRGAYDRGLLPRLRAPLKVISVGGLEAGGSGKTPVAGYLLTLLLQRGVRAGLLTRGYRRRSRGLVLRPPGQPALAAELGDEAAMLVHRLAAAGLDLPVAACAERVQGARALAALGCTVAVMDDGFVHRRLHRDLDVVVLRAEAPFGNGHFLPRGSLREAPAALARADVVWLHQAVGSSGKAAQPPADLAARLTACLGSLAGPQPTYALATSYAVVAPVASQAKQPPAWQGNVWVGAAGLARPASFAQLLARLGAHVAAFVAYADHHPYTAADVAYLVRLARRHDAVGVAVTAKDAVKLAPLWPLEASPLRIVHLDLVATVPLVITRCVNMCVEEGESTQPSAAGADTSF